MCEEWSRNFAAFYAEMGDRPPNATLDRIDNERGYEPGNCRWASTEQQMRNRSVTRLFDWRGQKMTAREIAEIEGIQYNTIRSSLARGYTIEETVARLKALT